MKYLGALLTLLFWSADVFAGIHAEVVEYKHGDATLEGYLVYNTSVKGKRPGVLVVHEWKGIGAHARHSADELAKLGYVAFAVDMYGKGIRPQTNEEAAVQAGIYKSDRNLMRSRILAGLDVLKNHKKVDTNRLGAIGYCFGGTTVLELARSGADIRGAVSFHGGLGTPNPEDAKNIKPKFCITILNATEMQCTKKCEQNLGLTPTA